MAETTLTFAKDARVQELQKFIIHTLWQRFFGIRKSGACGLVLHSGSEANEVALHIAREYYKGQRRKVLCTTQTHSSIAAACAKLELETIVIPVSEVTLCPDKQVLYEQISRNAEKICAVVATFGTTHTGTTEDAFASKEIMQICAEYDIRVHIDAAYGGYVLPLLRTYQLGKWAKLFARCASITVDPHKHASTWGCGVLLLQDSHDKVLLGTSARYYAGTHTALGTTRSAFPAATAAYILRHLSKKQMARMMQKCMAKADYCARELVAHSIPILHKIQTPNIAIRSRSQEHARRIQEIMYEHGYELAFVEIRTRHETFYGVRICITPRSTMTWKVVRKCIRTLVAVYIEVN